MLLIRILLLMAVGGVGVMPLYAQAPAPSPTQQAVSPEKEKAIRQLLAVTGTSKLMTQQVNQMIASLHGSIPGAPPEFWTKFRERIHADDLITLLIPVYDKYYTLDDINGLLAFYQTPLGQKVVATLPQISRESMIIGQAWGRKQAQAVIQELQQEEKAPKRHSTAKTTALSP